MEREQAIAVIRSSELSCDADLLIAALQEAISIRAERIELGALALGVSRFGGSPDLPREFDWPRCVGSVWVQDPTTLKTVRASQKEVCLSFLAQINLEELPRCRATGLLPLRGSLCFFYDCANQPWGGDPAEKMGWRIAYFDIPTAQLVRTKAPQVSPESEFFPCQLSYSMEWTLPDRGVSGDLVDSDSDWCYDVQELQMDLNPTIGAFTPLHRLFGHPSQIQGDMRLECQMAFHGIDSGSLGPRVGNLAVGAKDWRLLLQIDTDEEGPGWMWGDCGRIYYWIKDDDLRRQAFDAAWFVLQCS